MRRVLYLYHYVMTTFMSGSFLKHFLVNFKSFSFIRDNLRFGVNTYLLYNI